MTSTLTRAVATTALLGAVLAAAPTAAAATHPAPRAAAPHIRGLVHGLLSDITGGILTPVRGFSDHLGTWFDSAAGGLLGGSGLDISDLLTGTFSREGTAV
ncbi:hypothetical protein ABH931_002677 [Streptacidiphilus sp. MAP12-33]|uniref:hypothetical protein n=1 Tax=Streptacidiphilus sp. MAP12-33 TaxID=3156266 RepID=UPI003512B1D7